MPKVKTICRYIQQYAKARGGAGNDDIVDKFITRAKSKVAAIVKGEIT